MLLIIGVGAAVMSAILISQMEERPMAWAMHLRTFTSADTPPVMDPQGTACSGEADGVAIEFLYPDPFDVSLSQSGPPKWLLTGEWNLVQPFEYTFNHRIPRTDISTGMTTLEIDSGIHDYFVTVQNGGGVCVVSLRITGISVGDEFVLDGPCLSEVNTPVSYGVKLMDGGMVETPDDILSPAGITTDNGSVLTITNLTNNGRDTVQQEGVLKPGILSGRNEEIGPFEFIDTGDYELDLQWFEPPPPDGIGPPILVSKAKKLVTVFPAGMGPYVCGSACIFGVTNINRDLRPTGTGGTAAESEQEFTVHIPGIQNYRVAFLVERQAGSGGHEADKHKKVGSAALSGLTNGEWATHPKVPIGELTNGTVFQDAVAGEATVTYRVSKFGGTEKVTAYYLPSGKKFEIKNIATGAIELNAEAETDYKNQERVLKKVVSHTRFLGCQLGSVEIKVKVKDEFGNDLEALGQRIIDDGVTTITLVGGTPKHHGPPSHPSEDNNHFGTANLIDDVVDISIDFNSATGDDLMVNDMSLGKDGEGYGGLFDINGNWKKPHSRTYGHSFGRAADLDASDLDDIIDVIENPPYNYSEIFPSSGDPFTSKGFIDETNHIHVMR